MRAGSTLRVARPTDCLEAITAMYRDGLGLDLLGAFVDHDGFDGAILGHPGQSYHLEFTAQRGHSVGRASNGDQLLAFYVPDPDEWRAACARMVAAGFIPVASCNPYWDSAGRTFEDLDGYRVVLQCGSWHP